jgi:hypothetical protein
LDVFSGKVTGSYTHSTGGANIPFTAPFFGSQTYAYNGGTFELDLNGVSPGVNTTALLSGPFSVTEAVPEPATWALMGIGFACLGFLAYRRKERQVSFRIV